MFRYFKSDPTTHVMLFKGSKLIRQGAGDSFFHVPALTSIAALPTTVQDAQFAIKETTTDHQEIALQGDISYRISQPATTAAALDFRIDPKTHQYLTEDPEKIRNRIINALKAYAHALLRDKTLEDALGLAEQLSANLLTRLQTDPSVLELGITIDGLRVLHLTPTAETRKALEADFRERLNQRADQAIYARRKAALDEERRLQETEMATEVEMEERRRELVAMQAQNKTTLAEADAKAEEMKLSPYKNIPTQALIALGLIKWAEAGANIGQLNLAPDLLTQLAGWMNTSTTNH
ncbi:MAG: SPFH domain-containing protein [Pseudomonadota bacterium]